MKLMMSITALPVWTPLQPLKSLKWLVSSWCHPCRIVTVHVSLQWPAELEVNVTDSSGAVQPFLYQQWGNMNTWKQIILFCVRNFGRQFLNLPGERWFYLTGQLLVGFKGYSDTFPHKSLPVLYEENKLQAHTTRDATRIPQYGAARCNHSEIMHSLDIKALH